MAVQVTFELPLQGTAGPFLVERRLTVGRGTTADIAILDEGLSRMHCALEPHPDGLLVRDLGSTNGIYLDGARVQEARVPPHGQFWVGHVRAFVTPASGVTAALPEPGRPIAIDPQAALEAAAAAFDATSTHAMNQAPPQALRDLLRAGKKALREMPSGESSPGAAPPGTSSLIAKTVLPFATPLDLPKLAKTLPPFPAAPSASASPAKATEICLYFDGHQVPVDRLGLHFVTGEDGALFVRLAVGYQDGSGTERTAEAWLRSAT